MNNRVAFRVLLITGAVFVCLNTTLAQRSFANGLFLSLSMEYLPEKITLFLEGAIFTNKPNYGLQLGYERRFGSLFSASIGGAYYMGVSKGVTNLRDDQGYLYSGQYTKTIQRGHGDLYMGFWLLEKRKFALIPKLGVEIGQTFHLHSIVEDGSGTVVFPEINKSVSLNYINLAVGFENRYELKRLKSGYKGTYGALALKLTPYFLYNLVRNEEFTLLENRNVLLLGFGVQFGLQYMF